MSMFPSVFISANVIPNEGDNCAIFGRGLKSSCNFSSSEELMNIPVVNVFASNLLDVPIVEILYPGL